MRQHVNPLSKNFQEIEPIPPLDQIFQNPNLPLHLDIGCAAGGFLFDLALNNQKWNYLGIEIREKLVLNANLRKKSQEFKNLYFSFGNANNIFNNSDHKFLIDFTSSLSFYFPDPWFKKRHNKRRVIQNQLIKSLSSSLKKRSLIFIKTDVKKLFDYMDATILDNINFRELCINDFKCFESFNPKRIQTNREKYAMLNQLKVYERIYTKI